MVGPHHDKTFWCSLIGMICHRKYKELLLIVIMEAYNPI